MHEDTTTRILVGTMFTIAIFTVVIAVTSVIDSSKSVSRDFNGDGQVDIIDLSILAEEISTRNTNK